MDAVKHTSQSATSSISQAGQHVSGTSDTGSGSGSGTDSWNAMTEEQKQQAFDALPADQKQGRTYLEWLRDGYQHQRDNWMPWIEDVYLRWFTRDNKASYATRDTLNKTKVSGLEPVDRLQDGAHDLVAGQVGQGGLLQPAGDAVSREGVNRAERGGRGEGAGTSYTDSVVGGAQSAGGAVASGAKSAGGYVGGLFGGGGGGGGDQKEAAAVGQK